MPMSAHVRRLREVVGHELIMLPGVAAVVRDEEGRVLVHRRSDDGSWSLPAGAIEPGESRRQPSFAKCAKRPGSMFTPARVLGIFGWPRLRHRYPNGDLVEYLVVVFRCEMRRCSRRAGR
jgi:hypothetical protein